MTIEVKLLQVNLISLVHNALSTHCHMWAGTILVSITVLLIDLLSVKRL